MLTFVVCVPILAGLLLFLVPASAGRLRNILVETVTLAVSALTFWLLVTHQGETEVLFPILGNLTLTLRIDGPATIFAGLAAFLWPLSTLYGFEYMVHEGGERHFFAMYTVSFGVTLGIAFAGNLLTMYVFYEFLSLSTLPLVMHGSSDEAVRAGHRYMMFTFGGAALAFLGMLPILVWTGGSFTPGGVLGTEYFAAHPVLLQILFVCMFLGFAVKAAVFPFHSWLPAAAVAPTPVTALLHAAAVVKAGAFAAIRATYYIFGASNIYGTPAQAVVLLLAALTIVYGALQAVREHHLKRRLAWSTVSNLSYILMAAALMTEAGLTGALTHLLFHAIIKITLFFCAGAILVKTRKTEIESVRGLGQEMPFTAIVYAVAALALAGTPFLPGFISKWQIGSAALGSGSVLGFIGLAALLISAVLCAIYVLYPGFSMLFRKPDEPVTEKRDAGLLMKISMSILALAIILCGLFSNSIVEYIMGVAAASM